METNETSEHLFGRPRSWSDAGERIQKVSVGLSTLFAAQYISVVLSSQRPVPGRDRSAVNFSNSSSKAHARPHGCGGGCGVTSLTVSLLCYGPLARYRHRHPSGLLGTREDSFLEYTHTVASSERRRLPVEFALSIVRRLGDLRHLVGRYPNVKHRV